MLNGGEIKADPSLEGVESTTSVCVDYETKEQIILGTQYAGEMKKGCFGYMNYEMPMNGILSVHASANLGKEGDTTLGEGLGPTRVGPCPCMSSCILL